MKYADEIIKMTPGQREVAASITFLATTVMHHFGIHGIVKVQVTQDAGLRLGITPGHDMLVSTSVGDVLVEAVSNQPTLEAVVPVLPAPTDTAQAFAQAVIAEVNRLSGRSFRVGEESIKQAKALIRGRVTVETMLAMVRFMAEKWLPKPEMADNVRPSTLMRLSNAKRYIDEMEAGPVRARGAAPTFKTLGD